MDEEESRKGKGGTAGQKQAFPLTVWVMIKAQMVWDLGIRSLMKRRRTPLTALLLDYHGRRFIDTECGNRTTFRLLTIEPLRVPLETKYLNKRENFKVIRD